MYVIDAPEEQGSDHNFRRNKNDELPELLIFNRFPRNEREGTAGRILDNSPR